MNKFEIIKIFTGYSESRGIRLNPDAGFVEDIVEGLLVNQKKYGMKLCPCRLGDGSRSRDLELICPCDFEIQETWRTEGRCWCGLFYKL